MDVSSQLNQTMLQMVVSEMDVAEFYSPPRMTEMAKKMGLRAGWSMDITTNDVDGKAWDFNNKEMRNRAARRLLTYKPLLLVGSPMCTIRSTMHVINHARMDPEVVRSSKRDLRTHGNT